MKIKCGFLVMALAMSLCFTTSCTDDLVDYNVLGSISGMVIDLDTHDPVPYAIVTLNPSGKNTNTDNDGNFDFSGLVEPRYKIIVQKTGYQTNYTDITITSGGNDSVVIPLKKRN